MSNGIMARQNEENSIKKLAAQREIYNEVERLDYLSMFFSVIIPLALALMQSLKTQWSWISYVSYGLSFFMLWASIRISKACKKKKTIAASIQLSFDIYVFKMPWDRKLFGEQKNLNAAIVEKSKRIMNHENKKEKLFNWYTSEADGMEIEDGIMSCQKENYHWDVGLRKRYKVVAILAIVILSVMIFIIGVVKNEPFQDWIKRVIFVLPMFCWLRNLLNGLHEDMTRLEELDREFGGLGKRNMDELQEIEKSITEHRKNAVKIPNIIYIIFRNNDEDKEHNIAKLDAEQWKS